MNYYKRHLGDYAKDTRHLSLAEHGAYCLLLDYYYSTERPIPDDRCERIANAYTDDERKAVRNVLGAFFTLTDEGWRNARADSEIAEFHGKSLKAKEAANARWSGRNANAYANASDTHSGRNASHKPLAISQEPIECPAAPAKAATAARTYLGWVKSLPEDEDPLPATDPVFAYAKQVGLSDEFMALAWAWFENTYGPDGPRSSKRYTDWRKVFRNAVEGNWGKLWYVDGDGYRLTTVGLQLQRALRGAG